MTAPEIKTVARPHGGSGCGCGAEPVKAVKSAVKEDVTVLSEKLVAGFNAQVLEATSASALVAWLKDHGYEFLLSRKRISRR